MSHQSRKAGLPSVTRDAEQYEEAVARRFRLLSKAAAEYDAGDDDQVVVLAAMLRVLLSDQLINHVTPLDQLQFSDTANRLPDDAIGGYGYGITRILVRNGQDGGQITGRIAACLSGGYKDEPPPSTPFQDWWSTDKVVYPTNRAFLTREYVVYEMANTDAIHVDPKLDADYDALTRDNHGFTINGIPVSGNLASAAVRQIVWETQHTLHRVLPELCGSDFPNKLEWPAGHRYYRIAAYGPGVAPEGAHILHKPGLEIRLDD
jgi:hypothetical protein